MSSHPDPDRSPTEQEVPGNAKVLRHPLRWVAGHLPPVRPAEQDAEVPDVMEMLSSAQDYVERDFPGVVPASQGADHLDELIATRVEYVKGVARADVLRRYVKAVAPLFVAVVAVITASGAGLI